MVILLFVYAKIEGGKEMFDRQDGYYVTKGVQEAVPYQLQYFCWQLILQRAKKKDPTMDYLQIIGFDVDTEHEQLTIVHRQEKPEVKQIYHLHLFEEYRSLNVKKIWAIDDGQAQTMLLPEEY